MLVVDDSKSSRHMLRAALAEWGMEVAEAADGARSAAASRASPKPFDIVLLDWKLPDIDGVEMLARMRAAGRGPHAVLMLTAYGRGELVEALADRSPRRRARRSASLEKPASPAASEGDACWPPSASPRRPSRQRGARERQASDVLLPGVRILLVEDNPINQQVATELLETLGVETTVASSGEEALRSSRRASSI